MFLFNKPNSEIVSGYSAWIALQHNIEFPPESNEKYAKKKIKAKVLLCTDLVTANQDQVKVV